MNMYIQQYSPFCDSLKKVEWLNDKHEREYNAVMTAC